MPTPPEWLRRGAELIRTETARHREQAKPVQETTIESDEGFHLRIRTGIGDRLVPVDPKPDGSMRPRTDHGEHPVGD